MSFSLGSGPVDRRSTWSRVCTLVVIISNVEKILKWNYCVQVNIRHTESRSLRWSSGYPWKIILLALVLEFDSHRDEISLYLLKCKEWITCLLKAPSSVGTRKPTRVDEERHAEFFSRQNKKARTVVGRGEEGLLCDPGSRVLLLRGRARIVL